MHSEHSSERMHPASLHVTKPFHHSRHAQSVLTIPDTIRMGSSRMFCLMLFPKAIFQSQRGLNWTFPIQLRTSPATGSVKEIPGFQFYQPYLSMHEMLQGKNIPIRASCIAAAAFENLWLQLHCFTLFPEKLQQHFYMKTLLCCSLSAEFLWNEIIHPEGYWKNSVVFHVIIVNIKEIQSCFTSYCKALQKFLRYIFHAEAAGLQKKSYPWLTEIYQLRLHLWVSYHLYLILSFGSRSSYYHSLLKSKLKGELKSFQNKSVKLVSNLRLLRARFGYHGLY